MSAKKLTKSHNKVIAGICGGLANYFDFDPTMMRVLYVVASLFTTAFPGLLLYIILWVIMPDE